MKIVKYICFLLIPLIVIPILKITAQEISNYQYTLDNGIKINTTNGWNFVWVNQKMDSLETEERTGVSLHFIEVGNLISGDAMIEITSTEGDTIFPLGEKQDYYVLNPGKYRVSCKLPLEENNGSINFCIPGIAVKKGMKTNCTTVLNDVQLIIEKEPYNKDGLGTYSTVSMFSRNAEERGSVAYPNIYNPGNHSEKLEPAESINDVTHSIQPGKYDLFVDVDISWAGYGYQVWLENIEIEKNILKTYKLNLNGSKITVKCTEECPDMIHFYPRGSAEKIGLKEDKSMEIYSLEGPKGTNICPAGTYDILLNYGYGGRYEWKGSVKCKYGKLTVINVE